MSEGSPELYDDEADIRKRDVERAVLQSEVAAVALSPPRLDAFVTAALRARVWGTRRVLAHGLDPEISFEELLSDVRSHGPDRIAERACTRRSGLVPADMVGAWWRALGRVVALQGLDATDQLDGLVLHDVARALTPLSLWPAPYALTYAQLLWANGQRARLRDDDDLLAALNIEDRQALAVDLLRDSDGFASSAWNDALARMLGAVPGVTVAADATTPFDGLRAVSIPEPVDGPLVSVIMSSYRPGPEILTSVQSVLDQSWTNLELLVVDDASGTEYIDMLDRVAALDPRVRVLVQPENRGTYGARNRALPETRGDFVTFQDSDDWSHPERIARQMERLLEDPNLPAVMSRSIRCTPDLELQLLGYPTSRPNVSSLMLRRSTIETLGFFDHVRKGADSEYEERIAAHFGRRVKVMSDLLAFVRLDPDSLSRSDFGPGWWHPARYAYRDGYRRWHRAIAAGAAAWLSADTQDREFPAPRAFLRGTDHRHDDRPLDLLFVGDWREIGGTQSVLLQQVRMLAGRGMNVGIMHLESLHALDCRRNELCLEITELQFGGVITRVLPDEPVTVEKLVLGDPGLLNHAPDPLPAVEVRHVAILASTTPSDTTSGQHRYEPAAVSAMVKAIWEVDPVWIPGGEDIRTTLSVVDGVRLAAGNVAGVFDSEVVVPPAIRRGAPIIGAVVGAGEDRVPATAEEFLKLFPDDERFDVRLIVPRPRLFEILRRIPRHWLVYQPGDITQPDFYRQLDFFVSPAGSDRLHEVIPRVIDAVSAGAVAIVPPSYESTLGDAAAYATADEVSSVVQSLFVDPLRLAATIARGRASVRARFAATVVDQEPPPRRRKDRTEP